VVPDEDGLHDRGGAACAASQLVRLFRSLLVAMARSCIVRMRASEPVDRFFSRRAASAFGGV
jgi:hypothetical protein